MKFCYRIELRPQNRGPRSRLEDYFHAVAIEYDVERKDITTHIDEHITTFGKVQDVEVRFNPEKGNLRLVYLVYLRGGSNGHIWQRRETVNAFAQEICTRFNLAPPSIS